MKKIIIAAMVLSVTSACVSYEQYRKDISTWVGATEAQVVDAWGAPDEIYEHKSRRILSYTKIYDRYEVADPPIRQQGGLSTASLYDEEPIIRTCKTSFTLDKDIVRSWRAEGNGCRARIR